MEQLVVIDGLVLAGGKSRRMGEDKAQLCWQGSTLLRHQQALLSQVARGTIHVSGAYQSAINDLAAVSGQGPLAGLLSYLESASEAHACLVLPVDMPLIRSDYLNQLCSLYAKQASSYHTAGAQFPMLLPCTSELAESLKSRLAEPEPRLRSLKLWLSDIASVEVAYPHHPSDLTNANTPEQWEQIKQIAGEEYEPSGHR